MAQNQSMIDVPDRTGQIWQIRSVNAKRLVFVVVGPPKRHGSEWRHPTLVLMSDNRPDKVATLSTAAEPRPRGTYEDPGLVLELWEDTFGLTRIA